MCCVPSKTFFRYKFEAVRHTTGDVQPGCCCYGAAGNIRKRVPAQYIIIFLFWQRNNSLSSFHNRVGRQESLAVINLFYSECHRQGDDDTSLGLYLSHVVRI